MLLHTTASKESRDRSSSVHTASAAGHVQMRGVVCTNPLAVLHNAILEHKLCDSVLILGVEHGLELLVRRLSELALVALCGEEDVVGVYDFDDWYG